MIKLANKIKKKILNNTFDSNIIKTLNYYLREVFNINTSVDTILEWIDKNPELEKTLLDTDKYQMADYYNSEDAVVSIENKDMANVKVISTKSEFQNCRSKNIVLLLPWKEIPSMYLHTINLDDFYHRAMSSEEIEYYQNPLMIKMAWVKDIIKHYDSRRISDNLKLKECLESNIREFEKISKYQDTLIPNFLGEGEDGIVWEISPKNGYVIKFSKDNHGFLKAMESMNIMHKFPAFAKTEARIYDGGILKVNNNNIYYYILEKMLPIRDLEKDKTIKSSIKNLEAISHTIVTEFVKDHELFAKIKSYYQDLADKEIKNFTSEESDIVTQIGQYITSWAKDLKSKILTDGIPLYGRTLTPQEIKDIALKLNLNTDNDIWLENFIEEYLVKYITSRTDLHFGNLGITNYGQLRFYDPAHKDYTSQFNY